MFHSKVKLTEFPMLVRPVMYNATVTIQRFLHIIPRDLKTNKKKGTRKREKGVLGEGGWGEAIFLTTDNLHTTQQRMLRSLLRERNKAKINLVTLDPTSTCIT